MKYNRASSRQILPEVKRKMSSNKCQQCGLVNFAGATECRRCNTQVSWGAEGAAVAVASNQAEAFHPHAVGINPQPGYGTDYPADASMPMAAEYVSPYAQQPKLRTGHATASLVLGILGILSAGLFGIGSLIGLGLGIRATVKAKREPTIYGGRGVAIGGIVTNSLGLLTIIPIAIMTAFIISGVNMARMAANESMAIQHMHQIGSAEAVYQSTVGTGEAFGDLDELIEEGLLPADSANKYGYDFSIRLLDRESSDHTPYTGFEAVAVPRNYGWSGKMSFYTSDSYVVTYADKRGKEATSTDDPVDDYYDELQDPFARRRSTSRGPAEDWR
jgi:hypothetical protein